MKKVIISAMYIVAIFAAMAVTQLFDIDPDLHGLIIAAPLTLVAISEKRTALMEENDKLVKDGKEGVRKMTEDEEKKFDENVAEIERLDKEIGRIRAHEKLQGVDHKIPVVQLGDSREKFSLVRTIRNMSLNKPMEDADSKVMEMGMRDYKEAGVTPKGDITIPLVDHRHNQRADILAGTATQGAEVVSTDVLNLVGPLRNALVFSKFGATYLTGLTGDIDIPKYAGATAGWRGEVAAAPDAAGATSELSLSPLRITGILDISKRFLIQDSASAEGLLKTDLVAAVAAVLESTALGLTAASAGVNPAGLMLDADLVFEEGVVSNTEGVSLETAVDAANALEGNLGYITTPGLRGVMKSTVKVGSTDSRMMIENNEFNGYPIVSTANMATDLGTGSDQHGIVFANWRHLIIGQWGGIDLIVDPYSLAVTGQVRITVNSYWDYIFRHAGAIAHGASDLA